jgi:hypothetical protein
LLRLAVVGELRQLTITLSLGATTVHEEGHGCEQQRTASSATRDHRQAA